MPVRYIGSMGLGIGFAAFCFQTTVLHPWHMKMNGQLQTLRKEVEQMGKRMLEMEDQNIDLLAELQQRIQKRQYHFQE